jgi:adenylylsulfate kinase
MSWFFFSSAIQQEVLPGLNVRNINKMRPILKALSWRIAGSVVTFALVYLFARSLEIAAMVCGAELMVKAILYALHERIWRRIAPVPREAKPFVLWFTGLSGSGKSTLADLIYEHLVNKGYRVTRLDGDTVRSIFPNTGFTRDERNNHIRRIGYLASILEKNGVIVLSSFVSPYAESRDFVRGLCENFIEVHVATSLDECERRDVKGLYKKARTGDIQNFTGISDPYEPPVKPEIFVSTENRSIHDSAADILSYIHAYL